MSFKNLSLDRSLIETSLTNYDANLDFSLEESSANKYVCRASFPEDKPALINFFYNSNGKTTIQANQGANTDLGLAISNHIIEHCSVVVPSKDSLSLKNLSSDDFNLLLEYLVEECGATITEKDIPHGKKHTITGCQGDNVVITYYSNKTFLLQGCPILLHSQVIEFLCEYLSLNDIVQSQLNLVSTNLKSTDVLDEMSGKMPLSFEHLNPTVKALISPSVALGKLDIELTDYTVIAFPALRGLEGYLKYLFSRNGITIGRAGFAPFLLEGYHATLSQEACEQINCENTCKAINQCYSLYKNERHGLFHSNGVLANTRLISSRAEAVAIVDSVLRRIEESDNLIRG